MNETSNKDIFARLVGVAALSLAVVVLILLGTFAAGQSGTGAGITGGLTSTESTYIAQGGFGVGTEHSFNRIFNSTGQLVLGQSTSPITQILPGTCNIINYSSTIAASTTQQVDCDAGTTGAPVAISGIQSGDKIFIDLASTTPTTYGGLDLVKVAASTTAGTITLWIFNQTGAAFTWANSSTSSLPFIDIR